MSTSTNQDLSSSENRAVALRARPDLQFHRQQTGGQTAWNVKDPLGLQYTQLHVEEYTVLRLLDGRTSLDEIKIHLEREFAPRTFRHGDIQRLVGMLHQRGLLLAESAGQGQRLTQRKDERARRINRGRWSSPLSIRLPGLDPEPLLNVVYPAIRWVFSPLSVLLAVSLVAGAGVFVLLNFDELALRLPSFEQFFGGSNLVWLAIALSGTKILHELGHAFTCRHFGGECHEIGMMLLVLTPCLYCDTSDAWTIPNRWRRVAIAAAGMYVEVVLASACLFVWWFSQPGVLHFLALKVVFISGVSTLLFNLNPLLRYDGYYILADSLGIPNFWQRSRTAMLSVLSTLCLGLRVPGEARDEEHRWLFVSYGLASTCYRWFVVFFILWFLATFLEPYGLEIFGYAMIAFSLFGMIVTPVFGLIRFLRAPGRIWQVKWLRVTMTVAIAASLLAGILWIPLPQWVNTVAIVQPHAAKRVYVNTPGTVSSIRVEPGVEVAAGDAIMHLANHHVELEVAQLEGQLEQIHVNLKNLNRLEGQDPTASRRMPELEEALVNLQKRLDERRRDLARLKVVAPLSGVVMPPPQRLLPRSEPLELPPWEKTPLDRENEGCFLEAGTLVCWIGQPDRMEAQLVVNQSDIEFLQAGQRVQFKFDGLPYETFTGRIDEVSTTRLETVPPQLSIKGGGELPTEPRPNGDERPAIVSYEVRVPLQPQARTLVAGIRGRARVFVGQRTVGQRLWRYLAETFQFR